MGTSPNRVHGIGVKNHPFFSRQMIRPISSIGWMVPVSLLLCMMGNQNRVIGDGIGDI